MKRKHMIGCAALLVLGSLIASPWVHFGVSQRSTERTISSSLTPANRPDGSRVLEGSTLAVVAVGADPLALQIAERVAQDLRVDQPQLEIELVSGTLDRSAEGRWLPSLMLLVHVGSQDASGLLRRRDQWEVNFGLGRTPKALMDDQSSPLSGLRFEAQVTLDSTVAGFPPVWGISAELVELVAQEIREARADLGWEPRAQVSEAPGNSSTPFPEIPPLRVAGDLRLVYRGQREGGALEALWFVDTPGSFTVALETLASEAGADGWKKGSGHLSVQRRPVGLEFTRGNERVQVFPAHSEGHVRSDPDIPERLAIVYRKAPVEEK